MCIGVPMQVVELLEGAAWCEGRAGRRRIDLALVGPQSPGTWVLTFMDAAREVLSAERAARINSALEGLDAVLAGDTSAIDAFFPDLAGREPQLPEHLLKGRS